MTPDELIERLAAAGCVAPDEEAADLLSAAPDPPTLNGWIARREQGEPLAWIIGSIRFAGRTIGVDPGVYVPRFETEALARRAVQVVTESPGRGLADLCTGCGAVAAYVAAAVPDAVVAGADIDPRAARCARRNGVATIVGDLGAGFRSGRFDAVTAVTPYVPTAEMSFLPADVQRYEPRRALDGGRDGLDVLRGAIGDAARLLRPGGWFLTEIGGDQDRALGPELASAGFGLPSVWRDDDGDVRGLAAQLERPAVRFGLPRAARRPGS